MKLFYEEKLFFLDLQPEGIKYKLNFCHLGARNSLTVMAICAYDNGDIQNPHLNQAGKEAAMHCMHQIKN